MDYLKIEPNEEAERIMLELEVYCARQDIEPPQLTLELNAAAIGEQIGLIRRLLKEIKNDYWISEQSKKEMTDFLRDASLSMKRAAAGRFNPTELTAASVVNGRALPGGLRGVAVR